MNQLITPIGELIDSDPGTLKRRVGSVVADDSLEGFLVRNMRYIGVGLNGSYASIWVTA